MNCEVRWYKICHLSLNVLLHSLRAKFKCSNIHLYGSYSVQNGAKIHYYRRKLLRKMVSFHLHVYALHYNTNCWHACYCARSVSNNIVNGCVDDALFNAEQNIALTSNDGNSRQKKRISKLRMNVSNKNTMFVWFDIINREINL